MPIMPVRVEAPTFWPNSCICGTQAGPMLDTGTERNGERVYLCSLCSKLVAVTMGYAEGEEMDRLEAAAKELSQKTAELDRLTERVLMLDAERVALNGRNIALNDELETAHGRVAQLEQTLRDVRADLAGKLGVIEPEDEASAREVSPVGGH